MKWIKWETSWLHSTIRDQLDAAERATYHDFVVLAALNDDHLGSFKAASWESLARKLNTPIDVILSTRDKCLGDRITVEPSTNNEIVVSICNWNKYQFPYRASRKTSKAQKSASKTQPQSTVHKSTLEKSTLEEREREGASATASLSHSLPHSLPKDDLPRGDNGNAIYAALAAEVAKQDPRHPVHPEDAFPLTRLAEHLAEQADPRVVEEAIPGAVQEWLRASLGAGGRSIHLLRAIICAHLAISRQPPEPS